MKRILLDLKARQFLLQLRVTRALKSGKCSQRERRGKHHFLRAKCRVRRRIHAVNSQQSAIEQLPQIGCELSWRLGEAMGNVAHGEMVWRVFVLQMDERSFEDKVQNLTRQFG